MTDTPIRYERLEAFPIAYLKACVASREAIWPLFDTLRAACKANICGDPMAVIHGGAVKEGLLVEAAYPVSRSIETETVRTRVLEAAPALTRLHQGSHSTIRDTVLKVYDYLDRHAWTSTLVRREIYRVLDPAAPEKNVTEVQVVLHEWDQLLAAGAEKVLGAEARAQIMQGIEAITPESSFEDYTAWIEGAMARLDALTNDADQKCQIVSHCAHVFPPERIERLRTIYARGEFDDILREMYTDDFWYEKPVRQGNVIVMHKNPHEAEAYARAVTPAERRRAYCHCSFVHPYLDEVPARLSPTFCFCGAGWYRQLWEGILGQPVHIEQVETLVRGHDRCTLTITLPLDLAGDFSPALLK